MKVRHPLTGGVYTVQDDGHVHVELPDGRTGVFDAKGHHRSGELKDADAHLIGWIAGPKPDLRSPMSSSSLAAGAPRGVAVPTLSSRAELDADPTRRSKGMDLGLNGRKALITAASRGIGLAIAQTLADEGADVAICARAEGGLEEARKDLEARGAKVFTRAVDVADADALKAFVTDAAADLGGLDIFVSNASGGSGMGDDAWQANFDVDVMSAARGVEAAMPSLAASDAASIVFISSTAALEFLGVPQPYNAMKAALLAHASDLSQALARQGVRVNSVSPGPIYFEGGNWEMIKQAMPKMYEGALAQCAIGRMGAPEEVARAVAFIASPAASLITGANLVCDGGFTKRVAY